MSLSGASSARTAAASGWERWAILFATACVAYPVIWVVASGEPLPFGKDAGIGQFADLRVGVVCLLEMLLLVAAAFMPRFRGQQYILGCGTGMALATAFALLMYVGGSGMCFVLASSAIGSLARESRAHGP